MDGPLIYLFVIYITNFIFLITRMWWFHINIYNRKEWKSTMPEVWFNSKDNIIIFGKDVWEQISLNLNIFIINMLINSN